MANKDRPKKQLKRSSLTEWQNSNSKPPERVLNLPKIKEVPPEPGLDAMLYREDYFAKHRQPEEDIAESLREDSDDE